ncbi:hypothetical protein BJ138DRAFT_1019989 [Hygrophoropsis aurantiaca]|uniref:Uncharacterized protein n=1 Tax=Hygrophoropsis aurantiaca TaxID=72124 RepID=A0ACB7ZT09_9AGAM|nr:hypothetical protein BJ138DRAFT_1019989 [Hygrophoropsis aurantiaca]
MILTRGSNRASFMWGLSTHNTQIERLWVEVGSQFACSWRAFFYRLERLHRLDRENPAHLWLLHYLFLDEINADCQSFQDEWNAHPISGEGHDRSPNDMRFMGQTQHGLYSEDCVGIDPAAINDHFGVHGPEIHRHPAQTGAGHASDEDEESHGTDNDEAEAAQLANANSYHDPVSVPKHANPFQDEQYHQAFITALNTVVQRNMVPLGYGILQDEWDDDSYPSMEVIRSGRKRGKELRVGLPVTKWLPRAVRWCQALDILNRLQCMYEPVL